MHGRWSGSATSRMFARQDTEDSSFKLVNDRLRVLMADARDVFPADIIS